MPGIVINTLLIIFNFMLTRTLSGVLLLSPFTDEEYEVLRVSATHPKLPSLSGSNEIQTWVSLSPELHSIHFTILLNVA